jgi:hypothetical protein
MTQTRILQLSDRDSPSRAKRKTLIEVLCIIGIAPLAAWLAIGCIEWASTWLAGR